MNRKTLVTGVAMAAALGMMNPQLTRAGEREWATAGKILTGVVIAGTVAHIASAPCTRVEYVTERVYWAPPPPPPRVVCHPVRYERPACRPPRYGATHPIVIPTDRGRRLYQPAVPGHPAFVQSWNPHRGEWMTVAQHPSVW